MARHLNQSQIKSALKRGKSVECFLGSLVDGQIAWLELRPSGSSVELWRFDAFDDGDEDYLDVYSFGSVAEDFPDDPLARFGDAVSALSYAQDNESAAPDRWVNQFVIQDEYRDSLAAKK